MKYLVVVTGEGLAPEISSLAIRSGVDLSAPSSGWHLTVLPPFQLLGKNDLQDLKLELQSFAERQTRRTISIADPRLHPAGTTSSWVVSLSPALEDLLWLGGMAGECLDTVKPLLLEAPTLYPPHLTLIKRIEDRDRAEDLLWPIKRHFKPVSFVAKHLTLLCRRPAGESYAVVDRFPFHNPYA